MAPAASATTATATTATATPVEASPSFGDSALDVASDRPFGVLASDGLSASVLPESSFDGTLVSMSDGLSVSV